MLSQEAYDYSALKDKITHSTPWRPWPWPVRPCAGVQHRQCPGTECDTGSGEQPTGRWNGATSANGDGPTCCACRPEHHSTTRESHHLVFLVAVVIVVLKTVAARDTDTALFLVVGRLPDEHVFDSHCE